MILLSTFKDTRSRGVIGMAILLLSLYLPRMIAPGEGGPALPDLHEAMPLYLLLFGWLQDLPGWSAVFSLFLVAVISLMVVRISFREQLLPERSMMPALFFVLVAVIIPESRYMSPILVATLFYLLGFSLLFRVHDDRADSVRVFNASLLLAAGCLFWFKMIWFIPLFWIVLAYIRPLYLRELAYPLLGFGLMILFMLTWFWGIRDELESFRSLFTDHLGFAIHYKEPHFSAWIAYGTLALCLLMASVFRAGRLATDKTVVQNTYQALFFMFVAGALICIFIAGLVPSALAFVAVPASFVLSAFFHRKRSHWTLETLLLLLLLAIAFYQVMA